MAEMKSTTCHHHRPPQMIFCENNGNGDEDDHEDDISNSLATVDDLDPCPSNAIDEHNNDHGDDNDDDNHHHRNTNPSSQRKGDVKRADEEEEEEEEEEDDNVKQSHTNYDCDNIPGSTATPTLSSDLLDDGVNALTEQIMSGGIDAPAVITSMSTTATTGEASAAAAAKDGMSPPETSSEAVPRLETLDDDYLGVMERNELPVLHVGRVIGKGGEMIRDLQARSGCRIDVDQNVMDPNAPRYITYHGQSQEDIDFAKLLVSMVCQNNMLDDEEHHHHHHHPIELPLGKAVRRYIQVHKSVVGRIIGRGGDMIRDLQIKSHARIQVDHKGEYAGGMGGGGGGGGDGEEKDYPTSNGQQFRQVMITGTEESVQRAEEMIMELSNRHQVEFEIQQQQEHDQQLHGSSSSDFTFVSAGMEQYWDRRLYGARVGPPPTFGSIAGYGGAYGPPPLQEGNFPMPTWNTNRYLSNSLLLPTTSTMIETEIIPCAKENIGHVIGRRGITVNDLQWRSGCNIQIDRKGYKISISGSRHGIELAKNMIYNIFEQGPTHMYAGGRQPQFDEQEPSVPRSELVQPMPSQAAANQYPYPGGSLQNPSQPPTFVYNRPMIPQQQEFYPRQAQPMMMYGQLPQRQVFPHQQLLQPPIQDTSPTAQSVAAASSSSSASVWRAATTIDGRIYYYNINTMETRWDNPEG